MILQPEQVDPHCQGPKFVSYAIVCFQSFRISIVHEVFLQVIRSTQYLLDLLKFDLIYLYLIGFFCSNDTRLTRKSGLGK